MRIFICNVCMIFFILFLSSCITSSSPFNNFNPYSMILEQKWQIFDDSEFEIQGEEISDDGIDHQTGISAEVPSTVFANLINAGQYENVFVGKNLELIDKKRFQSPWWYRKEFDLPHLTDQEKILLVFEGINYSAEVWLNKQKIASPESIKGSFRMFRLDISDFVKPKNNVLAVKVYPPQPGDFTIGYVDWNPRPPDENMGLWRPVTLKRVKPVAIRNTFVQTDVDLETLDKAELRVSAELENLSDQKVECTVIGRLSEQKFTTSCLLNPKQKKTVVFEPDRHNALKITNPRLWWPHTIGKPHLYHLTMEVELDGKVSDRENVQFGIREVSDFINQDGHRGYKVNGKKILIRGGGWVDDLFLREDEKRLRAQMQYVRDMNLNSIRLEGFWGNSSKLYELADEYGILIMVGWSCHWEWKGYVGKDVDEFGGVKTDEEMDLVAESMRDQVLWLRNHPSVFVWVLGSDKLPRPTLEKKYYNIFSEIDQTRPTLASCGWLESEVSGSTRVKMNGPYGYVAPNYWYEDEKNGGAFGFNTETGPGPQPPPVESLRRMIPPDSLWPVNSVWNYHCSRHEFDNIDYFLEALNNRYGPSENVEEFTYKSQIASYEAMRPMFESFCVNKYQSTGIIQWMLNSAWPSVYWQLYDWYLRPNGAYYGAQKACQSFNLIFNYQNKDIYIHNDTLKDLERAVAHISLYNFDSEAVLTDTVITTVKQNSSKKIFDLSIPQDISQVFFLYLHLEDNTGKIIARNFYWLPKTFDKLDFENSKWFITPIKEYADMRSLNRLPETEIQYTYSILDKDKEQEVKLIMENTGEKIAFFIQLKLVREKTGECVLPVFWDDNYISLLPGEKRVLNVRFFKDDLKGQKPGIEINGLNINY
ncbi:MAG: glycoside hydrolase family 2 TIM barrel-domain containing protein [bacterium]